MDTHRENEERQNRDREAEQQRRREIAMGLKNFEKKCADYQPEANSQNKEQLKKLKNFETENRKLNEKVEIGKKTEESENLKEQEYLTELQNSEMENAKINAKENAAAKIKEKDQIK